MKIKCPKCKHEWEYKGSHKHYISCPDCRKNIRIKKEDVIEVFEK